MDDRMTLNFDLTITIGAIVSLGIAIVGWVRAGRAATDDAIYALSARIDRHETRLTATEQTVAGLPGANSIHDLRLELAGMKGELREMRAVMEGNAAIMGRLETIVTRHEDHLLDGARK